MLGLLLLSLAALSSASPLGTHHQLSTRHVLHEVPTGWTAVSRAPAEHLISMRIALKQARMDEMLSILDEVSDPDHARYGQYLSKTQVEELVAPNAETVQVVEKWLDTHGVKVTSRSPAGDWLHVTIPVSLAEQMLHTQYKVYRHASGSHVVRSESYALPRSLDAHVDVVQPTTFFGRVHERQLDRRTSMMLGPLRPVKSDALIAENTTLVPKNCSTTIAPVCLRTLYRTDQYNPVSMKNNTLGIAGFLGHRASDLDLRLFYGKFRSEATNSRFSTEIFGSIDSDQMPSSKEANLDTQYAGAISYPTPMIFYSTSGAAPSQPGLGLESNSEPYDEWLAHVLSKQNIPATISISYGEPEQTFSREYAYRVCRAFMQLAVRGVSVLVASGDTGVGNCTANGLGSLGRFQPTFPASCPYVTAVGGTERISPEVGCQISGGGFSDYFPQFSWQNSTVSKYLSVLGDKHRGLYNPRGRAIPDVAAQASNFVFALNGSLNMTSGTSASSPTFAGVVALLNDYRLSQGKPPLGFLNPWLYTKAASALNDIVSGSNPGCATEGFSAGPGWDPVTGLGTPDFVKLQMVV